MRINVKGTITTDESFDTNSDRTTTNQHVDLNITLPDEVVELIGCCKSYQQTGLTESQHQAIERNLAEDD